MVKKRERKEIELSAEEEKERTQVDDLFDKEESLKIIFNVDGGILQDFGSQEISDIDQNNVWRESQIAKVYQKCKDEFNSRCTIVCDIYEEVCSKLQQSNGFFNFLNCRSSDIMKYQHKLNNYIEENMSIIENLKGKLVVLCENISQNSQLNKSQNNCMGWLNIVPNCLLMVSRWNRLKANLEDIISTDVNSLLLQELIEKKNKLKYQIRLDSSFLSDNSIHIKFKDTSFISKLNGND